MPRASGPRRCWQPVSATRRTRHSPLFLRQAADTAQRLCHRGEERTGNTLPGNPRAAIMLPERRFPVRIRIGIPPEGLGRRHAQLTAWLDENCGADGWAMTPSGTRGVLNDALSIYFT